VAAVLVVVLVPMPMRVNAPLVVEYRDALRLYVTVRGTLTWCAREGAAVKKGQTVARLANASLEMEVARLSSERRRQQLFLANLQARRLAGVDDGARVPAAEAALADVEQRLAQQKRDAARLTIVAPADGTLLPPPSVPRKTGDTDTLESWSGTPLEPRNLGGYLEVGTLLCLLGGANRFEAVLHVAESDVELVAPGQRVRMVLDHVPGRVFWGSVVEIAKLDLEVMPRELAAAGDLPARTDDRGVARPIDTWYQARVRFDHDPPQPVARVHGSAKISVASRSLGAQLARYLKQTFSR
jgi:putative peptide zinc metalloprotease protein